MSLSYLSLLNETEVQAGTVNADSITVDKLTLPQLDKGILMLDATSDVFSQELKGDELLVGVSGDTPVGKLLLGTNNRVSVSNGSGSITLSTPQDIAIDSSVEFKEVTCGVMYSGSINATNANITSLTASSINATNASIISGSISSLNATSTVSTTLTAGTAYVGVMNCTNASITTGNIGSLNATSGTVTSLSSTTVTSNTVNAINVNSENANLSKTLFVGLGATTGSLSTLFGNIQTASMTSATITNATVSSLNCTSGTISSLSSASLTSTNSNITSLTCSNISMPSLSPSLPVKTNGSSVLTSAAINLNSSETTGVLPVNKGGTGSTSGGLITSITGTANQIIVSGTSAVTLSTPQNIASTSDVIFSTCRTTNDLRVTGNNRLDLGFGVTKEGNAGTISYQRFSSGLDIVGAGTNSSTRSVTFFAENGISTNGPFTCTGHTCSSINCSGTCSCNKLTVHDSVTCVSLTSQGHDCAGNINITSGGLFLPTSGGTPSSFNFYEEVSINDTMTGPWASNKNVTYRVTRYGRMVTVRVTLFTGLAITDSNALSVNGLPSRFRPAVGEFFTCHVVNNTDPLQRQLGSVFLNEVGKFIFYADVNFFPFNNGRTVGLPQDYNFTYSL